MPIKEAVGVEPERPASPVDASGALAAQIGSNNTQHNHFHAPATGSGRLRPPFSQTDSDVHDLLVEIADRLRPLYSDEITRLGLTRPEPLPLSWRSDEPPHDRLVGSLPDVKSTLNGVPDRQLVILGHAGSGKTTIAYQLASQLLQDILDGHDVPLPFLVPLSSWNPRSKSLFVWIQQRIETTFADLMAGRKDFDVRNLLSRGMVLPILDGLDEMAEVLQPETLRILEHRATPWVLTSREDAFRRASAQRPPNRRAGVVRVDPVGYIQAKAYLRATSCNDPAGGSPTWDPFFAELEAMGREDQARRTVELALSSPLLVSLAEIAYNDLRTGSPQNLLTTAAGSPTSVQSMLIENVVTHAFDPSLDSYFDYDGRRSDGTRRVWSNPQQVRRWLGFLARHLRETDLPNVRWWMLELSTPVVIFPLLSAMTTGLIFYAFTIGVVGHDFALQKCIFGFVGGAVLGLGGRYALAERQQSSADQIAEDDALSRSIRDEDPATLRKGFVGFFLLALPVLIAVVYELLLLSASFSRIVLQKATPVIDEITGWRTLLPASALVALLIDMLVVAVMYRLFARVSRHDMVDVETETAIDPRLRFGGWPFRFALLTAVVLAFAASLLGQVVLQRLADDGIIVWRDHQPDLSSTLLYATGFALAALALMGCLSRVVHFFVARAWLAFTGRLPWDLEAFLQDAADRRVLRRVGATYAFRHASLEEHFARPDLQGDQPAP